MIKLTNILKEIKIRSANNNNPHTSNEGLCDFLNNNIKDLIKKENISNDDDNDDIDYFVNTDIDDLKLELSGNENDEIIWNDEIGISYNWFCPEEDLSDGGSFEWEEDELNGVKYWVIKYNI